MACVASHKSRKICTHVSYVGFQPRILDPTTIPSNALMAAVNKVARHKLWLLWVTVWIGKHFSLEPNETVWHWTIIAICLAHSHTKASGIHKWKTFGAQRNERNWKNEVRDLLELTSQTIQFVFRFWLIFFSNFDKKTCILNNKRYMTNDKDTAQICY